MSADDPGPTLTDAAGMGGVIAQDGFDYQLWDALSRVPAWLANPAFEGMIFEGLEDFEARFFAPHAPQRRVAERYQGKSAQLMPKEVRQVFERFHAFDSKHPSVARLHTLVTQRLPPTLDWVGRDAARVRRARPFYAPFQTVIAASEEKLRDDFIEEYENELGDFVFHAVEIAERIIPDRDAGLNAFSVALGRSFPALDVGARKAEAAFDALEKLGRGSMGKMLERKELLLTIETALSSSLTSGVFPVHIRSDRTGSNETALEIDASAFCGGALAYPTTPTWATELIEPLQETARWLTSRTVSRVALGGSFRLTTGFVIGWSFRAATGFELEIPTRPNPWNTDDRPLAEDAEPERTIVEPTSKLQGDSMVVALGVLRRPADDLIAAGVDPASILSIDFKDPITSSRMAQRMVSVAKAAISSVATKLKPKVIDLHFAGPAAFAVALGHRWNAMGPTQLYELVPPTRAYVATALLP